MPPKVEQMKEYQKALNRILLYISSTEGLPVFKKAEELKIDDSIDLLQELINSKIIEEKQKMKIKYRYEDHIDECTVCIPYCPFCKNDLDINDLNYCYHCGQELVSEDE